MSWRRLLPSEDGTHHVVDGRPAYDERFDEVLKFHAPGLAPVLRGELAWHIDPAGAPAYERRFRRTFGFYDALAAVEDDEGWHHITPAGLDAYPQRYAWCGNYQERVCAVREHDGLYRHIDEVGAPCAAEAWRYAGDCRDGVAVVQRDDGRSTHVAPDGRLLHGRWFEDLDVFHKGLARARDDRGWTHVDRSGEPAYARRFVMVEPFYNGQARVEREGGALEVIDREGSTLRELRPPRRSDLARLSSDLVGFWRTQTIRSAVQLGVMEALPGSAEEIAQTAALDVDATRRLLRGLWELDLVAPRDGRWLATLTGALLQRASGSGMADASLLWAAEHYRAWDALPTALASGGSGFEAVFGASYFDWLATHPEPRRCFHATMSGYARHDYAGVGAHLDLRGARRVLDAGGGSGHLLWSVLEAHPEVRGILLDLPDSLGQVSVPSALAPRVEVVGGDLFERWPRDADCILLARVLHDWDDARARRILGRAAEALRPGGRIVVLEWVVRDDSPSGSLLDLNMLAVCGSRERGLAAWGDLATAAGLRVTETVELPRYGFAIALQGAAGREGADASGGASASSAPPPL